MVAVKVDAAPRAFDEAARRQALANETGSADLRLGGISFALKRSRRVDVIRFENADVRATLATGTPQGGWHLEVVVRATFLATHRLEDSLTVVRTVALLFGPILAMRLRRFDLAADFVGFPLRDDDSKCVVTRARGVTTFLAESKDVDEVSGVVCKPNTREHRATGRVTGLTAGAGSALMARLYVKSEEVMLAGREEKRAIEHALWRREGWDGKESVTRVEFQCRGELLDELRLRDIALLPDRLDSTWQYCSRWLRLIEQGSSTRQKRCRIDTRWVAVQSTIFRHRSSAATRDRSVRTAARAAQVLGAALSLSAAGGDLRPIDLGATEDGELRDEAGFAAAMTDSEAQTWVRENVHAVLSQVGDRTASAFINRHGPKGAVIVIAARFNATAARFSTVKQENGETR
ncbi:MAG: hypothetical protein K0R38_2693 [Polyangiaceae bacterium]|nr:hypothetical protein [Polyangiaceae bacterium]